MRSWIAGLATCLTLSLAMAGPAQALRCKEWVDLDAAGRTETLEAAIDEVLSSNRARKWTSINMGRIRECLMRRQRAIGIDFDDACARGKSVSMGVLDEILMGYVRTCAG